MVLHKNLWVKASHLRKDYLIIPLGPKIFICCLLLPLFLMGGVAQGEDAKKEINQKDVSVNNAINDLKRAIKTRDFSKLRYDVPEEKPLSWGSCVRDSGVSVSFDAIINKLSAISKNSNITINETPVKLLYITTIETKGWNGGRPYLYFRFKEAGDSWRWLGVYDCDSQSSDFRSAEKGDLVNPRGNIKLQRLISHVKQITQSKDFKMLRPYVPDKRVYYWGPCGPTDSGYDELSFNAITEILLRESKDVEIYFNPKPEVEWTYLKSMSIETEGWLGEYPFLTFTFSLVKNRLIWDGVCYSATPEFKLTKKGQFEVTYFRKPQLPRPGARTFKDYSALKARIEEIIKFKAFDALEPYAINRTLIFEKCSKAIMDKGDEYSRLEGKKKPVREVIEFLKKIAQDAKEIKFSGALHKTYYETVGWSGEYPFITFWIAEGRSGWELIGVTYCKTSVMEVLFPGQIRLKY